MYRNGIIGLVFALVLLWGGTAMAQIEDKCGLTGGTHELTFPYFATGGDWWSGIAIVNTTGHDLDRNNVCLVGAGNGEVFGKTPPVGWGNLGGNSMWVDLFENIATATEEPRFSGGTSLSVFTNDENLAGKLRGFTFLGNTIEGLGYDAFRGDNVVGAKELHFTYVPGGGADWWKGLAVFNNGPNPQAVRYTAYYSDGTEDEWDTTIPGNSMRVGLQGDATFWPTYDTNKAARIHIVSVGENAQNIMAFTMFGNFNEALGGVAPN